MKQFNAVIHRRLSPGSEKLHGSVSRFATAGPSAGSGGAICESIRRLWQKCLELAAEKGFNMI